MGDDSADMLGEYQSEMLRCYRDSNLDNNVVGWYRSTQMGQFLTESFLSYQHNYQESNKNNIVLIFDPSKTTQSHLSLHAYRLTASFMALYNTDAATSNGYADLCFKDIIEEIPIVYTHSSSLASAFLGELSVGGDLETRHEALELNLESFMQRNLNAMISSVDELTGEHTKFQGYQRLLAKQQAQQNFINTKRKIENNRREAAGEPELAPDDYSFLNNSGNITLPKTLVAPSRLEALLLAKQTVMYSKQINQFSALALPKVLALQSLQEPPK